MSHFPNSMHLIRDCLHTNFAGKIATLTRVAGGQKTVISWQDAPDDLFYKAGAKTKKVKLYCRNNLILCGKPLVGLFWTMLDANTYIVQTRKQLTVAAIRKAARKPFRRIL